MNRLLIANRGEISVRIAQAAAELGIETLAIYTKEDSLSLHRSRSDQAVLLEGNGVSPYLNIDQIVDIAIKSLGLKEISDFKPDEKIIDYILESDNNPSV